MSSLLKCGFISVSNPHLSDKDLENILEVSSKRNKELDITSTLYVYNDINFQNFEGNIENIKKLMKIIKSDKRHKKLNEITSNKIANRLMCDPIKIIRIKEDDLHMISNLLDLKEKYII